MLCLKICTWLDGSVIIDVSTDTGALARFIDPGGCFCSAWGVELLVEQAMAVIER